MSHSGKKGAATRNKLFEDENNQLTSIAKQAGMTSLMNC
jgi:hypothetical protein